MNRIDKKFVSLKKQDKKAFIVYITAGDPSLSVTHELVLAIEKSGADIVELGIPFSDPLADGPVIQAASQRALAKKITLKKIFVMVRHLRNNTDIPLVFMTYYNPVLRYGLEKFMEDCSAAGVDGVIVPDLPYEEAGSLVKLSGRRKVAPIFLAAPTSTKNRLKAIVRVSKGFIYYVSLTGVTGARKRLPEDIRTKVRYIKSLTVKPVCVGFGVSDAGQARGISGIADGVIVGSAVIKIIERNLNNRTRLISEVSNFTKNLARAVHNV